MMWYRELDQRQEREARARADISNMAFALTMAGLFLVACFAFFMVLSERGAGG